MSAFTSSPVFFRIGDDAGSLSLSLGELLLVFLEQTFAFLAGFFGVFEVIANGVGALLEHAIENRPAKLRKDDPQNDEGDEHGDEFIHLGQDGFDATALRSECIRGAAKSDSCCRCNNGADFACLGCVRFQLACLLFFLRKNHAVNRMD